jgi:hypothetical protein
VAVPGLSIPASKIQIRLVLWSAFALATSVEV